MLEQLRPNSILGILPPTICLIEIDSVKSVELLGYKEVVMRARRDDERDTSKGHPNNEHTASRQHDLVKTGLECNTQVIVVETLDAVKGSGKGLKEEKHMIPQTPPVVSSLTDRMMKYSMFKSHTSKTNQVISGENKLMFGDEEHIKRLELNRKRVVIFSDLYRNVMFVSFF